MKSLTAYYLELAKTEIWPFETQQKKPLNQILNSKGFVHFKYQAPEGSCVTCCSPWKGLSPAYLRSSVAGDFQGLCLDCMANSKIDSIESQYFENGKEDYYSVGCRITHGRTSWYFSFMGKEGQMEKWKKQKRAARGRDCFLS